MSLLGYQCAYGGTENLVRCYPDSGRDCRTGYFRGGTDPNNHIARGELLTNPNIHRRCGKGLFQFVKTLIDRRVIARRGRS